MLTLSLTRQQLYELYREEAEPTIRLIEKMIEQLADFEQIPGADEQRIIDAQHERNERLAARLKQVEAKLVRIFTTRYDPLVKHAARLNQPAKAERPDALSKHCEVPSRSGPRP